MIAVAVAVFSATAAAAQLSGGSSERTEKHGDLAPLSLRDLLEIVLVDGRTVYTPLFSGVYWDAQDLIMEDVERTEVIRGPGAALWGANAVNGVINVITRSAHDTEVSSSALLETRRRATELFGSEGETASTWAIGCSRNTRNKEATCSKAASPLSTRGTRPRLDSVSTGRRIETPAVLWGTSIGASCSPA